MVSAWIITRDVEEKNKKIKQILLAIVIMVFSLGIYQANLGCFCVPVILYMMKMLLDGENEKCFRIFRKSLYFFGLGKKIKSLQRYEKKRLYIASKQHYFN